jgi:hypothetical protein
VIDVRFTPDATKLLRSSEMTRRAITGREQLQQGNPLFDHLVGAGCQRWRQGKTQQLRSL